MESTNGAMVKEMQQRKQILSPREFIVRYIKYLPWIILSLVVGVIIGKIRLRYSVPIYKSEARLLIKRESPGRGNNDKFDEIFAGSSIQNVFNEMELLKSRPLAAKVAKRLNLQSVSYNKGKIRSTLLYNESPIAFELLPPFDSLATMSIELTITDNDHFRLADDPRLRSFGEIIKVKEGSFRVIKVMPVVYNLYASNVYILSKISLSQAAEMVVGGLKVSLVDNFAQIISLSYESESPSMAVDILNMLMDVYRETNIDDKRQMRISTLEFIDERLDSLRTELGIVEKDLTSFIERNKAFELGKQSELYLERLNQESSNRVQQEIKMNVIDWLINYLSNENNAWRAVPLDLGTQEPTLIPIINEYNKLQQERLNQLATAPESNPLFRDLNARISKLRVDLIEGLKNVRQTYIIANSNYRGQSAETENKLQSIPGKGQQLAERQRQQKIKEELYLFLLQKKEETAIASASTISDSKVVEPARSYGTPISPNSRSIYLISILLALALPTGIIVIKEYLNDKVNNKADIEKATSAPIIGEIGHSEGTGSLIVTKNSRKFISEQFRIIRTNLQFIVGKIEKPVIMVTSSFSGEGKSFVSVNIGSVMALTGKRTVILELDIRKPKVSANLELRKSTGITSYIVGHATIEDIVVPVPGNENLFVIPCGPVPPNPAEMLLDPRLKELFEYVKRNFDFVIVDTAPAGLVSDAIIIGEEVDCTLYILRQGYTYKKQLGLIDEFYLNKKLPKMSLILNDVTVSGGYGSYYGYGQKGYGYGYGAGYFDESVAVKKGFFNRIKDKIFK